MGIISADEVVISPRGRKAEFNDELLALLKSLKATQAATLDDTFGKIMETAERAAVSQKIRKHWSAVRSDECRIDYSPDGVPQVRVRVRK